jgi:8-oxo-dGTP pyrophosphatase MutT (NUDIX family)
MDEAIYNMEAKTMYCNNCGRRGHIFKSCTDPIISCGIMLINKPLLPVRANDVSILMVRRKDSMAYTEFLRGKYEVDKLEYVKTLLSNMTTGEHNKLKSLQFDELWTLHWGIGRDHHSREFEMSKEKFGKLAIAELTDGLQTYLESEWGFPKGRRANRETDTQCAIREFSEETNIPRDSYVVCKNLLLTESFNGTNGIKYKHIYFVALLREPESIDLLQTMTNMQKREVSAIEWKSIQECRRLTRPHYIQRSALLDSFERIIQTFDLQDNLSFNQG